MKTLMMIASVLCVASVSARAQNVNIAAVAKDDNVVTVTTGVEYGFALGVAYGRVVSVADRPVVVGGELTLGLAEIDAHDFRLRANGLMPIVGQGRWKVLGGLSTSLRGTHNEIASMVDFDADAAVFAGRYTRRTLIVAELGLDYGLATHIAHTDEYRMTVYADARDGWYGNPGGILHAGLQAGASFGRYDAFLRFGRLVDTSGEPPMLPFYGTVSAGTRW